MAEMLVLPRVSTKFKEDLRVTRYSKMVSKFQDLRQAACATLKADLRKHGVVAAANDDKELQDALAALSKRMSVTPHAPSVLMVYREEMDKAYGEIFSSMVTLEKRNE